MKYLRKWLLPDGTAVHRYEEVEHPEDWGMSFFWYCRHCARTYASCQLFAEHKDDVSTPRPWQAVSGICPECPEDKWNLAGSLEGAPTIGWKVPLEVARYQLAVEIEFLDHEKHPYNSKEVVE